jgi:isopentenyl-diphosphate Delta-isomerase
MRASARNMVIDRVDGANHVIGRIARGAVFKQKANFRVVHVIVKNRDGAILIQKIAGGLRHEGAWGSSVAGYLKAGETYKHAALRKLKDEVGLSVTKIASHGTTSMLDEDCQKFIGVYSVQHEGPFKLVPGHVAGIELLSLHEIVKEYRTHNRVFTSTFAHVMGFLYPHDFDGH